MSEKFRNFLTTKLSKGEGLQVLEKVEAGEYRASKLLMDHVSNIIRNQSEYVLLDEQLVVYDKVLTLAKKGLDAEKLAIEKENPVEVVEQPTT